MTWENIKLSVKNAVGWLVLNPQIALTFAGIIAGAFLILLVVGGIDSCRSQKTEQKKSAINANIIRANVEAEILTNQKTDIKEEIKNANTNSNTALADFNNSVRRDSGAFAGNAEDRFCRRFPSDSTCADWRGRNGF